MWFAKVRVIGQRSRNKERKAAGAELCGEGRDYRPSGGIITASSINMPENIGETAGPW